PIPMPIPSPNSFASSSSSSSSSRNYNTATKASSCSVSTFSLSSCSSSRPKTPYPPTPPPPPSTPLNQQAEKDRNHLATLRSRLAAVPSRKISLGPPQPYTPPREVGLRGGVKKVDVGGVTWRSRRNKSLSPPGTGMSGDTV